MSTTNLHRLAAGLGVRDQDQRRDFFERETGKRSQSDMTIREIDHVASALRREFGQRTKPVRKDPPHIAKMVMIWLKLSDAKVVCADARGLEAKLAALNGFVNSDKWALKWGETETHYRFLAVHRANDVIEALKDMARRHQVKGVWK